MMSKHIRLFLSFLWLLVLVAGCGRTTDIVDKLELIKKTGDTDPESALLMLDSLDIPVRDESDYVQMKYDLLSLRLHDKADDRPSSDITARRVVSYFEAEGSAAECQEAYYYAGASELVHSTHKQCGSDCSVIYAEEKRTIHFEFRDRMLLLLLTITGCPSSCHSRSFRSFLVHENG